MDNKCKLVFMCTAIEEEPTPVNIFKHCDFFEKDPMFDMRCCKHCGAVGECKSKEAKDKVLKESK